MIRTLILVFSLWTFAGLSGVQAFDLDELEQIEQLESLDLHDAAKAAAERDDIAEAERLLGEAVGKASSANERATRDAIDSARERIAERKRVAEEERRAEAERAEREAERERNARAAASHGSTGGGTSSREIKCITVDAQCTSGFGCVVDDVQVSGGPGVVDNSWSAPSICTGYNGAIAGTYGYTMRIGRMLCSGQFRLTEQVRSGVTVNVYPSSCQISYVNEY